MQLAFYGGIIGSWGSLSVEVCITFLGREGPGQLGGDKGSWAINHTHTSANTQGSSWGMGAPAGEEDLGTDSVHYSNRTSLKEPVISHSWYKRKYAEIPFSCTSLLIMANENTATVTLFIFLMRSGEMSTTRNFAPRLPETRKEWCDTGNEWVEDCLRLLGRENTVSNAMKTRIVTTVIATCPFKKMSSYDIRENPLHRYFTSIMKGAFMLLRKRPNSMDCHDFFVIKHHSFTKYYWKTFWTLHFLSYTT